MSTAAFQIFTTLLGLIVNVLTLGGFVFGVVELQPGWGPLSKPGPVLTLLYLFMVIVWLLVGFQFIRVLKRRYGLGPNEAIVPRDEWKDTFGNLMYLVTVPTTVLWILAWIELLGFPKSGPGSMNDDGSYLMLIGGATLFAGGFIVTRLVLTVDWLFNPKDYTVRP